MTNTKLRRNDELPPWAREILLSVYGGEHHWPSVYEFGHGYRFSHTGELATYDSNELTKLVVYAHRLGVRVSVSASGPRMVGVEMFQRERKDIRIDRMTRQHPSLRLALEILGELAEITPPGTGIGRAAYSTGDEAQYQSGAFTITETDGASQG